MLDINNAIAAFSEEQVTRVTGLSVSRLRYWAKTGFFAPSFVEADQRLAFSRFYSFKDVVALRTLEKLRVQNGVPLQHLRRVAEELSHLKDDLWTKTTLFVANRKVIFSDPETGKPREVLSGQYIIKYPLVEIAAEASEKIEGMRTRDNSQRGVIARIPGINRNNLVIAGTRISVDSILRLNEDGYSMSDIIREYPDLTLEDVKAALAHRKPAKAA